MRQFTKNATRNPQLSLKITFYPILSSRATRRICLHPRLCLQILRHFVPQDDMEEGTRMT